MERKGELDWVSNSAASSWRMVSESVRWTVREVGEDIGVSLSSDRKIAGVDCVSFS